MCFFGNKFYAFFFGAYGCFAIKRNGDFSAFFTCQICRNIDIIQVARNMQIARSYARTIKTFIVFDARIHYLKAIFSFYVSVNTEHKIATTTIKNTAFQLRYITILGSISHFETFLSDKTLLIKIDFIIKIQIRI